VLSTELRLIILLLYY